MRVVFLGSPVFAEVSLRALAASSHEVALVVTQPDRPAGRGRRLTEPPVKAAARAFGIEVAQPERVNTRAARARVAAARPEVVVVVAYGQILRPLFLALAPRGCLNVHASLLPRHRGASPINAQILAGDPEVGVSIMRMDEGLDTGPVALRAALPARRETAGELHDRLAPLGAALLVEALDRLEAGDLEFVPQGDEGASYAGLLDKADGALDLRASAQELDRRVRGLTPWPGAWVELSDGDRRLRLQLLEVEPIAASGSGGGPGALLEASGDRLVLACGRGALRILKLQPRGKKAMPAGAFLNGARLGATARVVLPDEETS